jgi:hypothetical protein
MAGMDPVLGMDMGSAGMFRPVNVYLAKTYWYLIVGATSCGLGINTITRINERRRLVKSFLHPSVLTLTTQV